MTKYWADKLAVELVGGPLDGCEVRLDCVTKFVVFPTGTRPLTEEEIAWYAKEKIPLPPWFYRKWRYQAREGTNKLDFVGEDRP